MAYQYVYILPLEQQRFYVGLSPDPETALFNHKFKKINQFTTKFPPLGEGGFLMAPSLGSASDVNEITKNLQKQYGYTCVRNCTKYKDFDLSLEQIENIKEELDIAKYSQTRMRIVKNPLTGEEESVKEKVMAKPQCSRCFRYYHTKFECICFRNVMGEIIDSVPEPYQSLVSQTTNKRKSELEPDESDQTSSSTKPKKSKSNEKGHEHDFSYATSNNTIRVGPPPKKVEDDNASESSSVPTGESTTDTDSNGSYNSDYENESDKEIAVERGILY